MTRLVKVKLALPSGDYYLATAHVDDGSDQWERRILGLTGNLRACGLDRTFERGGFTLTIDDTDEKFKALMENDTNRKIANCTATVYVYKQDGATLQETIVATITSWDREDGKFTVKFEQCFSGKLPQTPAAGELKINSTDWPNAPKKSLGKEVVYPMGVISQRKGGLYCWKLDIKPAAKFLLTWSDPAYAARVQSIESVFQNGAKVNASKYSLTRDVNGWEYISFNNGTAPKVRANITANASLFSAGNPVDSLKEGLAAVGVTLVDAADAFHDWCDTNSWTVIGAPTEMGTVMEYIELWCQNFDGWWWIDASGQVNIKHIDWTAISAVASLGDRHFLALRETATMDGFANRIKASLDYDYGKNEWGTVEEVDSTAGDYLPATIPVEKEMQYAIADFAGAVKPMASQLKYIDHPIQQVIGSITQDHYEQLGLSVMSIVTIDHYKQIGGSGKYLILREEKDFVNGTVEITAHRLWGA